MYRKGEVKYQALALPDRVQLPDDQALTAAETFRDYMKKRHSVRQFSDRPVPEAVIRAIIGAPPARWAKAVRRDRIIVWAFVAATLEGQWTILLRLLLVALAVFTALFALARTVGWVAQWNEMISDPNQKIGRPRQLYTGPEQRSYVAIDKR